MTETVNTSGSRIPYWPQWTAAIITFPLAITWGSFLGWMSPFLGHLSRPNPPFEVTKEHTTWIASLVSISRPIGIIFATKAINTLGSKTTLWLGGISYAVACIILILANSIQVVFGSLVVIGIGIGIQMTTLSFFVAEISNPKIRGGIFSFILHGQMIGACLGNLMGAHLSPWAFASVVLTLSIIFIVCFYFLPHTPHYLVYCNEMEKAKRAIQWYDRDADATMELQKLVQFLEKNPKLPYLKALRQLTTENRKIFITLSIVFSFIQLSGVITFFEYSEIIFINSKVSIIQPSTLVTIMAILSIPACWLSIYTTDAFGRVTMMFTSCVLLSIALASWGVNFHLLDQNFDNPNLQWIVIAGAIIFRVAFTIGILPISSLLLAELYPPNVKAIGACVNNILKALFMFISNKNFVYLVDYLSFKYTFYMFSALTLSVGIFVLVFIPETKGKTLQEIQEMLYKNKKSDDNCYSSIPLDLEKSEIKEDGKTETTYAGKLSQN